MNLWPLFSSIWGTCILWSTPNWGKKYSTGQRFIRKEVTSYKIHILTDTTFLRLTFRIPICSMVYSWGSFISCSILIVNFFRIWCFYVSEKTKDHKAELLQTERLSSHSKEAGLVNYLAFLAKVANLYYTILTAFKKYWPYIVVKFISGTQETFI